MRGRPRVLMSCTSVRATRTFAIASFSSGFSSMSTGSWLCVDTTRVGGFAGARASVLQGAGRPAQMRDGRNDGAAGCPASVFPHIADSVASSGEGAAMFR